MDCDVALFVLSRHLQKARSQQLRSNLCLLLTRASNSEICVSLLVSGLSCCYKSDGLALQLSINVFVLLSQMI